MGNKVKPFNAWRTNSTIETKGKVEISSNYNYNIKCFKCMESRHIASQCLNKSIMVMREYREIESKNDKFEEHKLPPLKDYSHIAM